MDDEVLNLVAGCVTQGLYAAEIDRIGLDQVGIELMLPNDLAEAITNGATAVPVSRLWRQLLWLWRRNCRFGERANFFDRADADAISLAESTIDSTRLGHAHLGPVDQ